MDLRYLFFKLRKKEELLGIWTKEDDGSGLLNIFGWSIEFKKDNLISYHWENNKKEKFEFYWKRINRNTIEISSDKENWKISYEIETYKGTYHYYFKLIEIGKEEFFNSPEPLFKRMY